MSVLATVRRRPVLGIATALIFAAAGAVAIAGGIGITGDNPVKVQEPVIFVAGTGVVNTQTNPATATLDTAAVIFNDDTSMTVSAQTFPGDTYNIVMALKNESQSVEQVQRLTIEAPDGFRFSAVTIGDPNSDSAIQGVGQEGPRSFLYQLGATATAAKLVLEVEVQPQVVPGFYSITFSTEALPTTTNFG